MYLEENQGLPLGNTTSNQQKYPTQLLQESQEFSMHDLPRNDREKSVLLNIRIKDTTIGMRSSLSYEMPKAMDKNKSLMSNM